MLKLQIHFNNFTFLEQRQNIRVKPAGVTEGCPNAPHPSFVRKRNRSADVVVVGDIVARRLKIVSYTVG